MIVQPGSPSRLAHLAFCGNDGDVRRANNIAFQRSVAGFGDPFSETPRKTSRVFGRRAVAFRDVTRRKETMCLAVLRCAGAMKISAASLPRDREKINITFPPRGRKAEEDREKEREFNAMLNRETLRG